MDAARTLARLVFTLFGAWCATCFAHAVEFPKRDALRLSRDRVSLRVQYVVSTSDEAQVLRRLFDRDRSGALEDPERQALLQHLCRQATAFVRLSLDGQPIELAIEHAELGADSTSADILLSAPLIEKLGRGRHQLRLFDRHKDRKVAVPLRVFSRDLQIHSALPPLVMLDESRPLEMSIEISAK